MAREISGRGQSATAGRGPLCGLAVVVLAGLLAAGCAGSGEGPSIPQAGLACVDDSAECIAKRQAALRQLVSDPNKAWIKEPPSVHAYASGVRLFAFKTKKKELSCDELSAGRREADAAPSVLRGSGNGGLTPAQVSRGVMFAAEVSRELGNEMGRRCKKA